jgi:hypothetical protein
MSTFVDQLLLQFSDPAQLAQLLAPAADTTHQRTRALLSAMYDFPDSSTIHEVQSVDVRAIEVQRPLLPPGYTRGTWTQTIPSHTRTDVVYETKDGLEPVWLDVSAEVSLVLVLEMDPGQVESITTRALADFNTLDEFRDQFRFIDLDAFMAEHDITTVEELRERYHYLLTEVRLRAPGPFDPNDPANAQRYTLNVAILIRETIDVQAALRDAKLARLALEDGLTYRHEVDTVEVRTPYAPVVVFPEGAFGGLPFDADAVRNVMAAEGVLALFVTP